MHDDSVLVAVEAALSRPAFCSCGTQLHLATHDDAVWLECDAFDRPSRLLNGLALLVRELGRDREHVIDLPETERQSPGEALLTWVAPSPTSSGLVAEHDVVAGNRSPRSRVATAVPTTPAG